MSVQIIRAPNGDELVVLPRAEYDALVAGQSSQDAEDAADVATFDAAMAELAQLRNGVLPEEVSKFLSGGDRLLKALRKWRGLSQVALARKAGIGQAHLSEIENGRKSGAPETIQALAAALDVPREWVE